MKFLAALIPMLLNGLGTLAGRIMTAFGLSAVTYVGLEALISGFKELNIFLGCLTFILTFKTLTKLMPTGKKG